MGGILSGLFGSSPAAPSTTAATAGASARGTGGGQGSRPAAAVSSAPPRTSPPTEAAARPASARPPAAAEGAASASGTRPAPTPPAAARTTGSGQPPPASPPTAQTQASAPPPTTANRSSAAAQTPAAPNPSPPASPPPPARVPRRGFGVESHTPPPSGHHTRSPSEASGSRPRRRTSAGDAKRVWPKALLVTGLVVAAGAVLFQRLVVRTYFNNGEVCSSQWIKQSATETNAQTTLYANLRSKLFGQDLAISDLSYAINGHINNENPDKPLVISMHGSRGIGKSYASRIVAEYLYTKGTKSAFVMRIQCSNAKQLAGLMERIEAQLALCPRSLFVFDDLEKAASLGQEAFNSIYHVLQHDYPASRRAIFILISNTGSREIAAIQQEMLKEGKTRAELNVTNIRKVVKNAAYREDNALKKTWLIDNSLISHYIPFLRLEKAQVELCIRKELSGFGVTPTETDVPRILAEMSFDGIWSEDGCRPVNNLVAEEKERDKERMQQGANSIDEP